jgi:para-aminobenzoate synthetase component 1
MEVFQGKEGKAGKKPFAWIDGTIKPLDQVCVPITDHGLQYGYGFFETIRVNRGEPKHLKEHIERFYQAWKCLFFHEPPDLTWDEIIDQVISQNGLQEETAAVKIIATRGDRENLPFNNTLVVTARPYTHRLEENNEPGLHLATYPEPRQTPLADHKTLNYLYYFLAGKWAKTKGADEALIMNPDSTVSETNTGNIMLIKDKTIITPDSTHVLPGIMEKQVCKLLTKWGYGIRHEQVLTEDLFGFDLVIITNSLIGSVPALSLDGKRLTKPSDLCNKINDILLK